MIFDWEGIHARLKANKTLLEQGWQPDENEIRGILKSRAKAIAQVEKNTDVLTDGLMVIVFVLGEEKYALDMGYVEEIYPVKAITPLPGTQKHILGIVNIRGQIISLVSLKPFFEMEEVGLSPHPMCILLRSESVAFGILADQIMGTDLIQTERLQKEVPTLIGVKRTYLKGITPEQVILLDADNLLLLPKMFEMEQG